MTFWFMYFIKVSLKIQVITSYTFPSFKFIKIVISKLIKEIISYCFEDSVYKITFETEIQLQFLSDHRFDHATFFVAEMPDSVLAIENSYFYIQ